MVGILEILIKNVGLNLEKSNERSESGKKVSTRFVMISK